MSVSYTHLDVYKRQGVTDAETGHAINFGESTQYKERSVVAFLNHFDEAVVSRIFHVFEISFIYHRNDMIREFTDEFFDFCGVYISSGRVVWIADDNHFCPVCNGCQHRVKVVAVIIGQWENDTDTAVILSLIHI